MLSLTADFHDDFDLFGAIYFDKTSL